jgi:adenine phosphoribosyltransferase
MEKRPSKCIGIPSSLEREVVIIDDLLATGGTAKGRNFSRFTLGGEVVEAQFLIELGFLSGRAALGSTATRSFLVF